MKKTVFCAFLIFIAAAAFAAKITTGGATAMQYINSSRRMVDKRVIVQYDPAAKLTYIYIEDVMGNYAVVLDPKQKTGLMGMISAYLRMEKEFSAKGLKTEAKIGDIITSLYFRYGDKWYMSRPDVPVFVKFLSQSAAVHQMVIVYGAAIASKDNSVTLSPSDRYFSKDQAEKLYIALENEGTGAKKGKARAAGER